MLRQIFLHGSLERASGISELTLDVDQQNQLFAALRARSTQLDMALRKHNELSIWTTNEYGTDIQGIEQGFNFGKAPQVHLAPHTEGSYFIPVAVWWAIAAAVVVSVATSMLMGHMSTNSNGAGGSKSTMFNGVTNDTDQGGAIPIVQGKRVLVGSTIIASDEDYVNLI